MKIEMQPIGIFHTDAESVPRHWRISDVQGRIEVDPVYVKGLQDIKPGQHIVVLFYFHKSEPFTPDHLIQNPPYRKIPTGVFSICSPIRPNPIGLSVLEVTGISQNVITVAHIDMIDGTPILDIKPHFDTAEAEDER